MIQRQLKNLPISLQARAMRSRNRPWARPRRDYVAFFLEDVLERFRRLNARHLNKAPDTCRCPDCAALAVLTLATRVREDAIAMYASELEPVQLREEDNEGLGLPPLGEFLGGTALLVAAVATAWLLLV